MSEDKKNFQMHADEKSTSHGIPTKTAPVDTMDCKVAQQWEVECRQISPGNVGMFALNKFKRGSLVFQERPACFVSTLIRPAHVEQTMPADFSPSKPVSRTDDVPNAPDFDLLYQILKQGGNLLSDVLKLSAGVRPKEARRMSLVGEVGILKWLAKKGVKTEKEMIRHLFRIIKCNDFSIHTLLSGFYVGPALFLDASRMNHSCDPNIVVLYGGDGSLFAVAAKNIQKGDELTHNYLSWKSASISTPERQTRLRNLYNFSCRCSLCSADEAPGSSVMRGTEGPHERSFISMLKAMPTRDRPDYHGRAVVILGMMPKSISNYKVTALELLQDFLPVYTYLPAKVPQTVVSLIKSVRETMADSQTLELEIIVGILHFIYFFEGHSQWKPAEFGEVPLALLARLTEKTIRSIFDFETAVSPMWTQLYGPQLELLSLGIKLYNANAVRSSSHEGSAVVGQSACQL